MNTSSAPQPAISEPGWVWDKLAVPETMVDLQMLIEDWKDCNMFFPMVGPPRGFFEMPTGSFAGGSSDSWEVMMRVVYFTFVWWAEGVDKSAEEMLCRHFWGLFLEIRKTYASKYGANTTPVLYWRIQPQLQREGGPHGRTALRMRFAVPGVDLQSMDCTALRMRFAVPGVDLQSERDDVPELPRGKV